jgi:hypothetical protein
MVALSLLTPVVQGTSGLGHWGRMILTSGRSSSRFVKEPGNSRQRIEQ